MPTNWDETLQQRYAREERERLIRLSTLTPEQIAEMETVLHNTTAQRDELLAVMEKIASGASVWKTPSWLKHMAQEAINKVKRG